jgi:hypothetical protein
MQGRTVGLGKARPPGDSPGAESSVILRPTRLRVRTCSLAEAGWGESEVPLPAADALLDLLRAPEPMVEEAIRYLLQEETEMTLSTTRPSGAACPCQTDGKD